MQKIKEIIIVEGQHDIDFLSSFLEANFIKTEGTSLPKQVIDQIKYLASKGNEFIILTDPDYPGEHIRNELLKIIPNAKQAFVHKENARTKKKVGVEHSSQQEVLSALENLVSYQDYIENIHQEDLYDLNLLGQENSSFLRNKISSYFFLGKSNGKTFLKRINMLNLTREELLSKIKEIINEN